MGQGADAEYHDAPAADGELTGDAEPNGSERVIRRTERRGADPAASSVIGRLSMKSYSLFCSVMILAHVGSGVSTADEVQNFSKEVKRLTSPRLVETHEQAKLRSVESELNFLLALVGEGERFIQDNSGRAGSPDGVTKADRQRGETLANGLVHYLQRTDQAVRAQDEPLNGTIEQRVNDTRRKGWELIKALTRFSKPA